MNFFGDCDEFQHDFKVSYCIYFANQVRRAFMHSHMALSKLLISQFAPEMYSGKITCNETVDATGLEQSEHQQYP